MTDARRNIREFSESQLKDWVQSSGEPAFRSKQIYEWLWKKSVRSFEAMTNLSKPLREKLDSEFIIHGIEIDTSQVSSDRTIKNAFRLFDGNIVEGVLIPTDTRMTACVSSQVGCSLTCTFCATGKLERLRNLNADEIYDQVAIIREQSLEHYNMPLSNIVFMGMGEPLLNYANVLKGIERITA